MDELKEFFEDLWSSDYFLKRALAGFVIAGAANALGNDLQRTLIALAAYLVVVARELHF